MFSVAESRDRTMRDYEVLTATELLACFRDIQSSCDDVEEFEHRCYACFEDNDYTEAELEKIYSFIDSVEF